ncbi:HamA C-terminal domain-containing protein [Paraburkholderia fungorum]
MAGPFFKVVVNDLARNPGLMGICAGFELGEWRADQLSKLLFQSLPDFCLRYSEYQSIDAENAAERLGEAARKVYQTDAYRNRGEFGELILHVALKKIFNSIPAISKIFFKDSSNHAVKGFDAVHVIPTQTGLELWLGEVKFYQDIAKAITDVCKELDAHFEREYLREEFLLIRGKIDEAWPHAGALHKLLDESTSLDEVFDGVVVPVLLTYNSPTTALHDRSTEAYLSALTTELERHYATFTSKNNLTHIEVRLILFPMREKKLLIDALHKRLETYRCL